jgi:hypothetical protein
MGASEPQAVQPGPQCAALDVVSKHDPPQAVCPDGHVKQSVLVALQPFAHDCVAGATHTPLALQTVALVFVVPVQEEPAPHVVFGGLFPVSRHIIDPVAHEVVPVLQGFAGVHAWLGTHARQVPARQYMFVPHIAPSAAGAHAPVPLQVPT